LSIVFGTDPEYLILDAQGHPVPAHKAGIPSKDHKLSLGGNEAKVFRDGYMVEINISPSDCRQTMSYRMRRALKSMSLRLQRQKLHLVSVPAVKINLAKDMSRAPADVKQFGCEPSYCAYDHVTKIPPIDAMHHVWRYAGGHLHFSPGKIYKLTGGFNWKPVWLSNPDNYPEAVRLFDQYIGLPLTCLFHSKLQYQRRKWYGQAGEYRPQSYPDGTPGLEYRTPGPEIWNLPWLSNLVLGIGREILLNFSQLSKTQSAVRGAAVRHAINTGEGRWALLKDLPDSPYKAALWRQLYMARPRTSTPRSLIVATDTAITDGFAHWWRKKGHRW
jgi:hypothetical protein